MGEGLWGFVGVVPFSLRQGLMVRRAGSNHDAVFVRVRKFVCFGMSRDGLGYFLWYWVRKVCFGMSKDGLGYFL